MEYYGGDLKQNGIPTPDNPVPIEIEDGYFEVIVDGKKFKIKDQKLKPIFKGKDGKWYKEV